MNIHPEARTTPKVRAEIRASSDSITALAARFHITKATVRKWKARESTEDRSHRAHDLQTTLTPEQEAVTVELRKTLLLPLDDLLVLVKKFINEAASRSGVNRCLKRHGVSNLKAMMPEEEGKKPDKKTFKDYEPGFLHVDIKYLPKMPDEKEHSYLFVAILRATRWVFFRIYKDQSQKSSLDFLKQLKAACPIKIQTILTDNGTQFTDRFAAKEKAPSGKHPFDVFCQTEKIDHRLIPPRHPQTNGMVERFNGRVGEILHQTRFKSAKELADTLNLYLKTYNHSIPQRNLNHETPVAAMKHWYKTKPELFIKNIYERAGLDIYTSFYLRILILILKENPLKRRHSREGGNLVCNTAP